MRLPSRPLLGATLLVLAAMTAACGGGSDASPSAGSTSQPVQYVALGDSYTAAPGLPQPDGDDGCQRSLSNYPHLLAQQDTNLQLTDVSCSGANSGDVLSKQDASLSTSTGLVTVGIGGNDQNLFTTLIGGCVLLAKSDPTGAPCTKIGQSRATTALAAIRTDVDGVLADIAKRAPNARIIVVGYPQVLPSDGSTCPALVPIAKGDFAFVNATNAGLSKDLQESAAAHGADFVDVAAASQGHDICAKVPWINGQSTAADGVIPFHPFGAEQQAVAGLIAGML